MTETFTAQMATSHAGAWRVYVVRLGESEW